MSDEEVALRFLRSRETRNTVVFEEVYARAGQPVVGTLYVRKKALGAWGEVEVLEVTIRPARDV
ncbi:MAG: hypothetical protein ABWZ52_13845 [Acidimicrobiales bacterium]